MNKLTWIKEIGIKYATQEHLSYRFFKTEPKK